MIFFFNDTATTEIYTLSLHDALPISERFVNMLRIFKTRSPMSMGAWCLSVFGGLAGASGGADLIGRGDRKSTRLNSSHANILYAVFCFKKKKKKLYLNNIHLISRPRN